ncbi:MAG: beta-galactosidase, partial [Roseburia sp.]|nr:beta-galactosidase [Roseburia sp.]
LEEMLNKGISFSLYMTHGGTNWGHWAGANSPGFKPDVTSYDYDAPVSESGGATPKYHALRESLAKYADKPLPAIPDSVPTITIDRFILTEVAPLFDNLPSARHDAEIRTMEEYDQGFGSILYRTILPASGAERQLTINDPHDFAQIFVDGQYIGKLDRRLGEKDLTLPAVDKEASLDILVEAMGRINFGRAIKDFKGITDSVTISTPRGETEKLSGWDVFNITDELGLYEAMKFKPLSGIGHSDRDRLPVGVYRGTFDVSRPADTFLDFSTWGKGLVYVNGYPLGRIWEIGPQQTLYTPGCWLREGENEIIVFDIVGPRETKVEGLRSPINNRLQKFDDTVRKLGAKIDFSDSKPALEHSLMSGNGWQEVKFPSPVKGRYVSIEMLSPIKKGDEAAIAELYLKDGRGERLERESWSIAYVDSEDTTGGNHTADKIFDLQESTYWSVHKGSKYPHNIIIDLGSEQTLSGLQWLPRMEAGAPGAVKDIKVSVK